MLVTLEQAVAKLLVGGVIVFPTETVYGLGAVATNPQAVDRVYQIKNRPRDNPLICHFASLEQIEQYAKVNPLTRFLLHQLAPGPLSVLLDLPTNSPLLPATCGLPTMVARIPNHPLTLELIRRLNQPLAGPSANTSGKFSGTDPEMILQDFKDKIDGLLDGGNCTIGLESTILDARTDQTIIILRQGAIGFKELQQALHGSPFSTVVIQSGQQNPTSIVTPGSKYRHYAPQTPVIWLTDEQQLATLPPKQTILFGGQTSQLANLQKHHTVLFLGDNLKQIAHNFYRKLYELDQLQVAQAWLLIPILDQSSLGQALLEKISKIALS